jgi:hypothetical protein
MGTNHKVATKDGHRFSKGPSLCTLQNIFVSHLVLQHHVSKVGMNRNCAAWCRVALRNTISIPLEIPPIGLFTQSFRCQVNLCRTARDVIPGINPIFVCRAVHLLICRIVWIGLKGL